jgi:hypothetical protein
LFGLEPGWKVIWSKIYILIVVAMEVLFKVLSQALSEMRNACALPILSICIHSWMLISGVVDLLIFVMQSQSVSRP